MILMKRLTANLSIPYLPSFKARILIRKKKRKTTKKTVSLLRKISKTICLSTSCNTFEKKEKNHQFVLKKLCVQIVCNLVVDRVDKCDIQ